MKNIKIILLSIIFCLTLSVVPTKTLGSTERAIISSAGLQDTHNEYLLLKSANNTKSIEKITALGIKIFETNNKLGVIQIAVNKEQSNALITELAKDPFTIYIEKDQKASLSFIPNDPLLNMQTYLSSSNVINAWDKSLGSPSVTVAVIDTGVNYFHEDLQGILWNSPKNQFGYDFVNEDENPMDDHGHGTNIAGIIAANISNGIGTAGIANVKIMALKAMNSSGDGFASDISEAIYYAADNGARVINLSLGLPDASETVSRAVNYAYTKGSIVIAATGNSGVKKIDSPASHPLAIGVGALNSAESVAEFTNYGPELDIMAMGENVFSPTWTPTNMFTLYQYNRGTSFAAPQVSGVAALIISKDPSLSADQLRKRLIVSAKKIPGMQASSFSERYGWGKIDADLSLSFDTTGPTITATSFVLGNGVFQVSGNVKEDIADSAFLPNTTNSNINQVRYQIDGGEWKILPNTKIADSLAIDFVTPNLTPNSNHIINLEATDTSGNVTRKTIETKDSTVGAISQVASDYKASIVSQSSYPRISPGGQATMKITYKNTGKSLWTREKVRLGTAKPYDRISQFADSSWRSPSRIEMKEAVVAPGETATFEFTIKGTSAYGDFKEYFALVSEGVSWFSDVGMHWVIKSEKPSYHAQYVSQSPFTIVAAGETTTLWVEYKNTGTQSWSDGNVSLGASRPNDRNSLFYNPAAGSGWKSANRIKMDKNSVAPGETTRFTFTIKAPTSPGVYKEYFRPVADGVGWMEDYGLYWTIAVQ